MSGFFTSTQSGTNYQNPWSGQMPGILSGQLALNQLFGLGPQTEQDYSAQNAASANPAFAPQILEMQGLQKTDPALATLLSNTPVAYWGNVKQNVAAARQNGWMPAAAPVAQPSPQAPQGGGNVGYGPAPQAQWNPSNRQAPWQGGAPSAPLSGGGGQGSPGMMGLNAGIPIPGAGQGGQVDALMKNAPQYFPGQTVAGFTGSQRQALGGMAQRGLGGSQAERTGLAGIMGTAQGRYLAPGSNPWLSGAFNQAADAVTSRMGSEFRNQYGSPAHQASLGRAYGDIAQGIYGGNYQQERGRQFAAQQGLPGMSQQIDYGNLDRAYQAGALQQGQNQQEINAAKDRWDYWQNAPMNQLRNYTALQSGQSYGGQGGSQMQQNLSPWDMFKNIAGTGAGITGILGAAGLL